MIDNLNFLYFCFLNCAGVFITPLVIIYMTTSCIVIDKLSKRHSINSKNSMDLLFLRIIIYCIIFFGFAKLQFHEFNSLQKLQLQSVFKYKRLNSFTNLGYKHNDQ